MKLVSGPALYAAAKSYGCFPLEGTVSKECSLIWEGEEASGRDEGPKETRPIRRLLCLKTRLEA